MGFAGRGMSEALKLGNGLAVLHIQLEYHKWDWSLNQVEQSEPQL